MTEWVGAAGTQEEDRVEKEDALLVVVPFGTYTIKELTAVAEVEAEVEVVGGLEKRPLSARGRDKDNRSD